MRRRSSVIVGPSEESQHQIRVAEAHIRVWHHRSYRAVDGEGVACQEPGCGWGLGTIERLPEQRVDLSDIRLSAAGDRLVETLQMPCRRFNQICIVHHDRWPCRAGLTASDVTDPTTREG